MGSGSEGTAAKPEKSKLTPQAEEAGVKAMLAALSDEEKAAFPDPNMPLRHLRADKGDVKVATRKIKETLAWRKEFQVDKIAKCFAEGGDEELRKIIREENATGKVYVRGYNREGRATMYMRPQHENTKGEINQMRHLVYNLERAVACTTRTSGYEKINLMIDFEGYRLRDAPPLSTTKHTLNILQNHYPERMYKAYICNPPMAFRAFWMMLQPFLDPITREKINFCHGKAGVTKVAERYDLANVERCGGGVDGANCPPFNSDDYLALPLAYAFGEAYEK